MSVILQHAVLDYLTLCLSTHHGGGVVLRELLVGEGDPSL